MHDPYYATSKGIRVGSTESEVLTKYGIAPQEKNDYRITYKDGNYTINFQLSDGIVEEIDISSAGSEG